MQETCVRSLSQKNPREKEMATHCSILAWRIPWTEKPGALQSKGWQRVRNDWATEQQQKPWSQCSSKWQIEEYLIYTSKLVWRFFLLLLVLFQISPMIDIKWESAKKGKSWQRHVTSPQSSGWSGKALNGSSAEGCITQVGSVCTRMGLDTRAKVTKRRGLGNLKI